MPNALHCHHFASQHCLSCQWLSKSYQDQINEKSTDLKRLISPFILQKTEIFAPFVSYQTAFRNKAKMVVSGSVEKPILGILRDQNDPQSAVDTVAHLDFKYNSEKNNVRLSGRIRFYQWDLNMH